MMSKIKRASTGRKPSLRNQNLNILLWILICFFLSRFVMYLVYAVQMDSLSFRAFWDGMNIWDAGWYQRYVTGIMDRNWLQEVNEDGQAIWAFFPLYPLIITALCKLLSIRDGMILLGSIVSSLLFLAAEYVSYKYIMLTRRSLTEAYHFIGFMSFGVYSFYFSILYTESLFLLLLFLCFYFMEKQSYLKMGICGALLSATRNAGVMFVFVILANCIVNYLRSPNRKGPKDFILCHLKNERLVLGTFLVPAGLFSYMAFLHCSLGDGFAFLHIQKTWGREYDSVLMMILRSVWHIIPKNYLSVWAFLFFVLILACVIVNRRIPEMVFPAIVLLMGISSTLQSIPRFMIGSATIVLGFCDFYEKLSRPLRVLVFLLICIAELALINQWILHNEMLT